LFIFRGGPKRTFAAPAKIKDKNGKSINIGGGRRPDSGNFFLFAGDAKSEQTDKGQVIIYEGERIEVPEGKSAGITGTASAVHAVDWDGDGDLDLLVGDIGGNVYLVTNEGTASSYSFATDGPNQLQAGGKPLHVAGDAGPFAADWDGDGRIDLIVGAGDGGVSYFRNTGSVKAPELASPVQLVAPGSASFGGDAPHEPRRGIRSKVCVADWNGDGRLDLLLGDFATQKPKPPELTDEEKAEHDKLRKDLDALRQDYNKLYEKAYGASKVTDETERKQFQKQFGEVRTKMYELQSKLPREYENHGWVWLLLRKPAETTAGGR